MESKGQHNLVTHQGIKKLVIIKDRWSVSDAVMDDGEEMITHVQAVL
jgi:hypothetical protein